MCICDKMKRFLILLSFFVIFSQDPNMDLFCFVFVVAVAVVFCGVFCAFLHADSHEGKEEIKIPI